MDKKLELKAQPDTPYVLFDRATGTFQMKGRSMPEDAAAFYEPIFSWLDEYATEPLPETFFEFELEYFNSSSLKQVLHLLLELEKLGSKGSKVTILWRYHAYDEIMEMKGQELASLIDVPFKFAEVS